MKELWTIKEIIELTDISERTIERAMQSGALRYMKIKSAQASTQTRTGKSVQARRYIKTEWLTQWLGYDPLAEVERARREGETRRQPTRFVDRTGQRYGKLVALSFVRRKIKRKSEKRPFATQIYWLCKCDCGKLREVEACRLQPNSKRAAFSCAACSQEVKRERLSEAGKRQLREQLFQGVPESSPFVLNYRAYRAQFTPQQQARYEELMQGRKGERHEAHAVDVVMREPQPGACCELCIKQELPHAEMQPTTMPAVEKAINRSKADEPKKVADHRRDRSPVAPHLSGRTEADDANRIRPADRLSLLRAVWQGRAAGPQSRARAQSLVA